MHPTQNPVSPAIHPGIADTLRRAAYYLIRHGWTQHNYYCRPTPRATPSNVKAFPPADVAGALVLAVTGRTLLPSEIYGECGWEAAREFCLAVSFLHDWLGLPGVFDLDTARFDGLGALSRWNDSRWQDQAHVVDGLLCAAAEADGLIYLPDSHRPCAVDFAAMGFISGSAR